MTGVKYESAKSFADGVEWCIALGLDLSQSDIMAMRIALQARNAFLAGLEVPERALLPHNTLPMPWRVEFIRIEQACGGGVPTIADLKRTLPTFVKEKVSAVPQKLGGPQAGSGPKQGSEEWRAAIAPPR